MKIFEQLNNLTTKAMTEETSKDDLKLYKSGLHSGGVWERDGKLYKKIKEFNKIEAEIYQKFKGNPIILDAELVEIDGETYLELPKLIEVIDTGKQEDSYADVLEGTSHLIRDEIENINDFFSDLTNAGYAYNDKIQVGFDEDGDFKIFDFSNAMQKSSKTELIESNLQFLSLFYDSVGFDVISDIIRKVRYVIGVLRVNLSGRISQAYAKEVGAENLETLKNNNDFTVRGAYYTTNRRGVMLKSKFLQLEYRQYQIILTEKPLSESEKKSWELKKLMEV